MKRALFAILASALLMGGCGGGARNSSSNNNNSAASFQGAWEVSIPYSNGAVDYVEINVQQNGSVLSASGPTQITNFMLDQNGNLGCAHPDCIPDDTGLSASVQGTTVSGTLTGGGGPAVAYSLSGTATANDGSITGSWTSDVFTNEPGGNFTATKVAPLSGHYSGTLNFSDGTQNTVSVTVSQTSAGAASVTGTVSGPDAGEISLTGVVIGNAAAVQGAVSGESAVVYAWLHNSRLYVVSNGEVLGSLQ